MSILESQLFAALVGGFFGILAVIIAYRLQERKKLVEWDFSSTSLLVNKGKAKSPLILSIDKSILTGESTDIGAISSIEKAYAFFISVRNVGNEPIERPIIQVQLDKSARIVQLLTEPESSQQGYEIKNLTHLGENIIRLEVPYLNPKGDKIELKIDIVSVNNINESCNVEVLGVGIDQRRRQQTNRLRESALNGPLVLFGVFVVSLVALGIISFVPSFQELIQENLVIAAAVLPLVLGILTFLLLGIRNESS